MNTYNATQEQIKAMLEGRLSAVLVPLKRQPKFCIGKLYSQWSYDYAGGTLLAPNELEMISRLNENAAAISPYQPGQLVAVREPYSITDDGHIWYKYTDQSRLAVTLKWLSAARMPIKHSRFTWRMGEREVVRIKQLPVKKVIKTLGTKFKLTPKEYLVQFILRWYEKYQKDYPAETNPCCFYYPVEVIAKNISEVGE